jgi:hypothetical protein
MIAIADQAGEAETNAMILHIGMAMPQHSHQIACLYVEVASDHFYVLSNSSFANPPTK